MKKNDCLFVRILILFLIFFWSSNLKAQINDFGNINRYNRENYALGMPQNKEKRIVFIGNSITEGWTNIDPDFFKNNDYIGRGISGQSSYQYLVRFREDVVNLHPAIVIINAGTNDIAENTCPFNEDNTFGNIMSMVEIAKANKIKVILTSVLPTDHFGWNNNISNVADKILSLNKRIEKYAKDNRIIYADYYSDMIYGDNKALNPNYTLDGVHPNKNGYAVMEKIIQKEIKRIR